MDSVEAGQLRESMTGHEQAPIRRSAQDHVHHDSGSFVVEMLGRFIEDQERRIGQQCASEPKTLPFAAGQGVAPEMAVEREFKAHGAEHLRQANIICINSKSEILANRRIECVG